MANSRRHQFVASSTEDTVVDRNSQYPMLQLPNGFKQTVDPAPPSVYQPAEFLSPQVTDVRDPASVTNTRDLVVTVPDTSHPGLLPASVVDTSDFASFTITVGRATAAPDTPRRDLLSTPSRHSGQSEDSDQRTTFLRNKILSAIASFLSLCLYLALRAGTARHTSCESNCD